MYENISSMKKRARFVIVGYYESRKRRPAADDASRFHRFDLSSYL